MARLFPAPIIGQSAASGAQIIDGSLKFNGATNPNYLSRDLSAGNRKTWTMSYWFKYDSTTNNRRYISTGYDVGKTYGFYIGDNSHLITFNDTGTDAANVNIRPSAVLRDNGWYHLVFNLDTTQSTEADRARIYVNGVKQTVFSTNTIPNEDATGNMNNSGLELTIGCWNYGGTYGSGLEGQIAQFYHIDGQALGPENFGFNDPLTNTWKPKKYTGTFTGTNTFYLPFDGNSPIGKDQSGNGNDFTPVNFGGSVALDNPQVSGARPILDTTQGGTRAGIGVFGTRESKYYTTTTANGSVYQFDITSGDNPSLDFIRGVTYKFDYSSHSSHPVLFSSSNPDSSTTAYTTGTSIASNVISFTVPHNAPDTLYYYCSNHPTAMNGAISITTDNTKADQYASNCVLAVPMVGVTTDVCASIACTANNKPITNSSVDASSIQSNFYSASHHWSSNSDTLNVAQVGDELVFGTGDFTIECWLYDDNGHSGSGGRCYIFDNRIGGSVVGDPPTMVGYVDSHNEFNFYDGDSTITFTVGSTVGKWWHYAVTREGTTTRMFIDGIEKGSSTSSTNFTNNGIGIGRATDGGYGWSGYIQDFRVYKGVAKYTSNFVIPATNPDILPDTPSGVSGDSKLTKITEGAVTGFETTSDYLSLAASSDFEFTGDHTIEMFIYHNTLSNDSVPYATGGSGSADQIYISSSGQIYYSYGQTGSITSAPGEIVTNKWQHLAISREGTNLRAFVDGKIVVSSSNSSATIGSSSNTAYIGVRGADGNHPVQGFISNLRIVKGSAVYTKEFFPPTAPLTNVTNTKLLCCQSNTSATEGAVKPGNITAAGAAAATNFNPFNTDISTVRGLKSGYATLNPADSAAPLKDGNLQQGTTSGWQSSKSTIGLTSGRWYWETQNMQTAAAILGIADASASSFPSGSIFGSTGHSGGDSNPAWTWAGANYYFNATSAASGSLSNHLAGDIVMYALDVDAGKLWFGRNGVWYDSSWDGGANPASGTNQTVSITTGRTYMPAGTVHSGGAVWNFGQKPFKFPPPDGFQPINAANVRPVKVVGLSTQFVGVTTYAGDGTSVVVNDFNFKPDFVWLKGYTDPDRHGLYDSVRGATKYLQSSEVVEEDTQNGVVSFDEKGFSVGNYGETNGSGRGYVAFAWKAGGGKTSGGGFFKDDVEYASAATAGLTAGDITPDAASIGTKQGFSIIKYQGDGNQPTTVPHGLNSALKFMIIKNLSSENNWAVFHMGLIDGATVRYLRLNTADSQVTGSGHFGNTAPTNTVFTLGSDNQVNKDDDNYIAYCWHDVPGFQKFGVFTGSNTSDGCFVELGFRPSVVLIKCRTTSNDWILFNNARNPRNPVNRQLWPYTTSGTYGAYDQVGSEYPMDFLSNGFNMKTADADMNGAAPFIYAAWAEAPAIDLYGGGANAR